MRQERVLTVRVEHHVAEGTWIAEVPELQGCVAFAHSEAEVMQQLPKAIADYLELFEGADTVEVGELVRLPELTPDDNVARSEVKVLAGAC